MCTEDRCTTNGGWSEWGECSVTCGGGSRGRTRRVVSAARHGGAECEAGRDEEERCGDRCCPPLCSDKADLVETGGGCPHCVCRPGWAGPGTHCGQDGDRCSTVLF